jgi:C4-dicarboxylate transporter DctM subunit
VLTPTGGGLRSHAFLIAVFVYRDVRFREVPKVADGQDDRNADVHIGNAYLFSFVLTTEQVPQLASQWITDQGLPPWGFLIVLNLLLLVAGSFMEATSVVLIFAPILFPIATALGIDPIHLGIIMTVNMEIGMITPPVGLNLFVTSGVSDLPVTKVIRAALPWLVVLLAALIVETYVP